VEVLYSDLLRKQGYRTGFFGKWHAKMPKGYKPDAHFDVFEGINRNPFYKKQPDGSLRHETELIVDRGIAFLEDQPKDKPFAINMWFNACHAEDGDRRPGIGHFPWPRAVDGMYDDITIAPPRLNDPAIFEAQPNFLQTTINRERYFWRWNTPEKYQTNIRAYYRMVSGIDGAIGRFLKALDAAGLADNTIIVYTADNGYHLGNRGFAGKWSHYEESLRVPMIIYDPRVAPARKGQVVDEIAMNLDLPSTFLDWAGAEIPERYQGQSLKPIVNGQTPADWRTESFHEHFAVRHRIPAFEGVRNARFKYVRYVDNGEREFLHDLKNDPDELVNLADSPEHAVMLKAMRQRLDESVTAYGGPLKAANGPGPSTVLHPEAAAKTRFQKADADGFVSLFDGKRLRQWAGDTGLWSVKNGTIIGKTDGTLKQNRFLAWKHSTVRNFDLRMKVKISAGGNSGIQYRAKSRPEIGLDVVSGYQCDVVADASAYNGMMYEERGRGILGFSGEKVVVAPDGKRWVVGGMPIKEFASSEWHEYRILVRGNHCQHWIDGHATADMVDHHEAGRALEGILAFQLHKGKPMTVELTDLKIKQLPDNLPLKTLADTPIPATAHGVRPQGKLPKDWQPPIYGERAR
jgi:choline-sulfatase